MNKKRASGLLTFFSMLPLVSAFDLSRGPEQVIEWIKEFSIPFFEALLDTGTYDQFFFSKVLVLILLFVVIYSVSQKLPFIEEEQMGIRLIIASVISIVGMRYIAEVDFIQGILLPYSVLAIAITIGITFMIFGFFIHDLPSASARKIGWVMYLGIFLGIWWDRATELSRGANIAYAIMFILVAIVVIFDRTIHEYLGLKESREAERTILGHRLAHVQAELQKFNAITVQTNQIKKTIEDLEKSQKILNKRLSRL